MGGRGARSMTLNDGVNGKFSVGASFTVKDEANDYYAKITEAVDQAGNTGIIVRNYTKEGSLIDANFVKSVDTSLEEFRQRAINNISHPTVSKIRGKTSAMREQERIEYYDKKVKEARNLNPYKRAEEYQKLRKELNADKRIKEKNKAQVRNIILAEAFWGNT